MSMCWKYEDSYRLGCSDHLFFPADEPEVLTKIEEWFDAKIDRDRDELKYSFLDMLEMWHEKGIIKPNKKEE